jgi:hypothetical protein
MAAPGKPCEYWQPISFSIFSWSSVSTPSAIGRFSRQRVYSYAALFSRILELKMATVANCLRHTGYQAVFLALVVTLTGMLRRVKKHCLIMLKLDVVERFSRIRSLPKIHSFMQIKLQVIVTHCTVE